jgi:hypothetical protein
MNIRRQKLQSPFWVNFTINVDREHAVVMFLASSSKGFDLFEYWDLCAIRFLDGRDITVLHRVFKRLSRTKSFSQDFAVFCQLFLEDRLE